MRTVNLHFPIVVYPSSGKGMRRFVAHCLNLDILSDDDSVQGAISQLLELIEHHLDTAEKHDADPFRPAPKRFWAMLGRARRVPRELIERILKEANARHGKASDPKTTIEPSQIDARKLVAV